jgi:hypothetical protein
MIGTSPANTTNRFMIPNDRLSLTDNNNLLDTDSIGKGFIHFNSNHVQNHFLKSTSNNHLSSSTNINEYSTFPIQMQDKPKILYPRTFAGKFCHLPDQFIIFQSDLNCKTTTTTTTTTLTVNNNKREYNEILLNKKQQLKMVNYQINDIQNEPQNTTANTSIITLGTSPPMTTTPTPTPPPLPPPVPQQQSQSSTSSSSTQLSQQQQQQSLNITPTPIKSINKRINNKSLLKNSFIRLFDISSLTNTSRLLANNYAIVGSSLESICKYNCSVSLQLKRMDTFKIWELLKFITLNRDESINLIDNYINSNNGRPWSATTFARPFINSLINNLIEQNDLQTIAMIILQMKQFDLKMFNNLNIIDQSIDDDIDHLHLQKFNNKKGVKKRKTNYFDLADSLKEGVDTNLDNYYDYDDSHLNIEDDFESASSYLDENDKYNEESDECLPNDHHTSSKLNELKLLDPKRFKEFDNYIKVYSEILYRWSLYGKRAETFNLLSKKPLNIDKKFGNFIIIFNSKILKIQKVFLI